MKPRFAFTQEQREAILKPLGEMMTAFRVLKGLSQQELATRAQMTRQMIADIETGRVNISLDRWVKTLYALDCILIPDLHPKVLTIEIVLGNIHAAALNRDSHTSRILIAMLSDLRKRQGLSQEKFSQWVQISRRTWSKIEVRKPTISLLKFIQIVTFAGLKIHVQIENMDPLTRQDTGRNASLVFSCVRECTENNPKNTRFEAFATGIQTLTEK